nr:10398_t:CDS:2 [Entrophospora candida]CAG8521365.1 12638_t:CDS:2 [Entrophospora candida]
MIEWIILCVILYLLHKTNPTSTSFHNFISKKNESSSSTTSTSKELFGFFKKIFSDQPTVPEYTRDDYVIFSIVNLKDGSATYLGVGGVWFVLSQIELIETGGIGGSGKETAVELKILEGSANQEKENAIQAKGKRDYNSAAKYYISAAKKFEKINDNYSLLEAAGCYEDAYKSLQQTKQPDKAIEMLEKAALIYEINDRQSTRAARIYEQIAEQYKKSTVNSSLKNLGKALTAHEKAAELFEREGDGRHLYSIISQAEVAAEIGYYDKSILLFDSIMFTVANDNLLQYKATGFIYCQCICMIGLGDWIRLEKFLADSIDLYPTFADSRECKFIKELITARNSFDPSTFATACKNFDNFSKLSPWQTNILLQAKKSLETEDLK